MASDSSAEIPINQEPPSPESDPRFESLQEQLRQSAEHFGVLLRRVEELETAVGFHAHELSDNDARREVIYGRLATVERRINERWGVEKAHCPRCGRIIASATGKCGICGA